MGCPKKKYFVLFQNKEGIALFVYLFGFYGISTFEGYLMPNPFFFSSI